MLEQLCKRGDVATSLIDVRKLDLSSMDAGESIKDAGFSEAMLRADGLVIVLPEYNHAYPGILKHVLDSLPLMRELGMVSIFWDVNVSSAGKAFDASGALLDQALPRRIDKMRGELAWMARVLRYGRDNVSMSDSSMSSPMKCTACGMPMNQHAEKVDFSSASSADPVFYGTVQEVHQCAGCANVQIRPASL
jgi:hypothetical protein